MFVVKRNGRKETVHYDKITSRIAKLCYGLDPKHVDPAIISQKVIQGVYPGVTTVELDELAAQTAASCATKHPDFSTLAARISVSNLHKQTSKVFSEVIERLRNHVHPKTGQAAPLVSEDVYQTVMENKERLNSAVVYDRDFNYDYFGFKTLERAYLMSCGKEIVERPQVRLGMPCKSTRTTPHAPLTSSKIQIPLATHGPSSPPAVQHMILRVALGIHGRDIEAALETYELMSRQVPQPTPRPVDRFRGTLHSHNVLLVFFLRKPFGQLFTHATPTLYNAGTPNPQVTPLSRINRTHLPSMLH